MLAQLRETPGFCRKIRVLLGCDIINIPKLVEWIGYDQLQRTAL